MLESHDQFGTRRGSVDNSAVLDDLVLHAYVRRKVLVAPAGEALAALVERTATYERSSRCRS